MRVRLPLSSRTIQGMKSWRPRSSVMEGDGSSGLGLGGLGAKVMLNSVEEEREEVMVRRWQRVREREEGRERWREARDEEKAATAADIAAIGCGGSGDWWVGELGFWLGAQCCEFFGCGFGKDEKGFFFFFFPYNSRSHKFVDVSEKTSSIFG